jgi:hypothetical protein
VDSVGLFPEGERGNTKPFWQAYRMRPWNRGFVRAAIARCAPIVPAAILGGEECVPVAWTVKFLERRIGAVIGLPLSLVPLPSAWEIAFHPPGALAHRRRAERPGHGAADAGSPRRRAPARATVVARRGGGAPAARRRTRDAGRRSPRAVAPRGLGVRIDSGAPVWFASHLFSSPFS